MSLVSSIVALIAGIDNVGHRPGATYTSGHATEQILNTPSRNLEVVRPKKNVNRPPGHKRRTRTRKD